MIYAPETTHGNRGGSWSNRRKAALNAFDITFDGRISAGRHQNDTPSYTERTGSGSGTVSVMPIRSVIN
jgi:hypothetical protein